MAIRLRGLYNISRNSRLFHLSTSQFKLVQYVLSDIGEGIREVTVRDWFVKVGDRVSQFDDICLVESDKASVNITSRYDGTVKKLYHDIGDLALVGKPLVDIDVSDGGTVEAQIENTPNTPEADVKLDEYSPEYKALATPAVRRIAAENKVTLKDIVGTGRNGRVMKEDILKYLSKEPTSQAVQEEAKDTIQPITGIKKVMFRTMTESHAIPSFGFSDEIDVSALVEMRSQIKAYAVKKNVNITYMPFFIKALSKCLESYPLLNSQLDSDHANLILKKDHNIGVAIDTSNGLVVPNIKKVQTLSILEIAQQLNSLISKGQKGTLSPGDFASGTFTISNVGIIGGTYVRPLINPPEVAIVGLGKFIKRPVFDEEDNVRAATMCFASWSADHRVIDGATMARFAQMWKEYLENPSHLILNL